MNRKIALIDNGSLRPSATLRLRGIAARLSERLECRVDPVSMAHSVRISPDELGGEPAVVWKQYVEQSIGEATREIIAIPLFFGPSRAISASLPKQFENASKEREQIELKIAETLIRRSAPDDDGIARIAADSIIHKLDTEACGKTLPVVLVDHGSPSREVGECRDIVAAQLRKILGSRVEYVVASSMERRTGTEYDFNEPLLEKLLNGGLETESNAICVSLMFLLPGRHAGDGGDIAEIVSKSKWIKEGKSVILTDLIGESDALIDLLLERYREVSGD